MALRIDPGRSALVALEFQNDVVMPGSSFGEGGEAAAAHAKSRNALPNAKSVLAAARAAGLPVIHVQYVVERGATGLKLNTGLFQAVKDVKGLVRGTWGAAPVKGFEPRRGELVVEKMRMNAFHGTNLAVLLDGLGADTIVAMGGWTNLSVEHTCRHAADAGFRPVVVTDATWTLSEEWQQAALDYALSVVAEQATAAEVVAALRRRTRPKRS
ncbi:MAG: cysteine hydrolase [Gaiellales bacterium]